jgi:hypothetical protein
MAADRAVRIRIGCTLESLARSGGLVKRRCRRAGSCEPIDMALSDCIGLVLVAEIVLAPLPRPLSFMPLAYPGGMKERGRGRGGMTKHASRYSRAPWTERLRLNEGLA